MANTHLFGFDSDVLRGITTNHLQTGSAASSRPDVEFRHLEDRVERLSLVCMAMWSLIRDKTDLAEEDLMERVRLLDLMDGVEDGKATKTVSKCAKCDRPMNARHRKCIYCGHDKLIQSAFDAI